MRCRAPWGMLSRTSHSSPSGMRGDHLGLFEGFAGFAVSAFDRRPTPREECWVSLCFDFGLCRKRHRQASFDIRATALSIMYLVVGSGGIRLTPLYHLLYHLIARDTLTVISAEPIRRVSSGCSLASRIGFSAIWSGMKLLIDPLIQTHLLHLFDVAGTRTKGQAIQRMWSTF